MATHSIAIGELREETQASWVPMIAIARPDDHVL
jgi:hypothetical protein